MGRAIVGTIGILWGFSALINFYIRAFVYGQGYAGGHTIFLIAGLFAFAFGIYHLLGGIGSMTTSSGKKPKKKKRKRPQRPVDDEES